MHTKDDVLTSTVGPINDRYMPPKNYSGAGGGRAIRPSRTSQRSAAPAVAAKMVAGAMTATGVTAAAAAGGPWKSTAEAVVTVPRWACPCRASGESGRERAVASMVAHSEVVMAAGVAVDW